MPCSITRQSSLESPHTQGACLRGGGEPSVHNFVH